MATEERLGCGRHRGVAALGDFSALERVVDAESEYERVPGGETTLQLVEVACHALIRVDLVLGGVGERLGRRLLREVGDVVRPVRILRAIAGRGDTPESVA